jgi:hypothetical protein
MRHEFTINVCVGIIHDLLMCSGLLFTFNGRITSTTEGCTIANMTDYVVYA